MKKLSKELFISQIDRHRRDDCERYDTCLNIAAIADWKSFSCEGCGSYKYELKDSIDDFVFRSVECIFPPTVSIAIDSRTQKKLARQKKRQKEIHDGRTD